MIRSKTTDCQECGHVQSCEQCLLTQRWLCFQCQPRESKDYNWSENQREARTVWGGARCLVRAIASNFTFRIESRREKRNDGSDEFNRVLNEPASPNQLRILRELAETAGKNLEAECRKWLMTPVSQLTKNDASSMIGHFRWEACRGGQE